MRRAKGIILLIAGGLMSFSGCKKPYAPSIGASNSNYLVVEGTINSGADSTLIKLSRTVSLSGKISSAPELNAVVTVESDQNNIYVIPETGKGWYAAPALGLDNTHKYRLRIKTSGGKEYLSDMEAVKPTPPIDSIGYTIQAKGLNIYANTHDPANNTRYYRWDYTETWQFHSLHQSNFISNGEEIVLRTPEQQIYDCFNSDTSSSIIVGSSAKLSQDIIYQAPITQIVNTSEKLETKYSILIKQYALTKEAFDFWQNLQKNSEKLGSIFDAQPTNLNGNIHCTTNPAEPVIGYISITNPQQKRVFITDTQLPITFSPAYPYQCEQDTFLFCKIIPQSTLGCINQVQADLIPPGSSTIPTSQLFAPGSPTVIGYLGTSVECTDCTIRGTKKQPDFWR